MFSVGAIIAVFLIALLLKVLSRDYSFFRDFPGLKVYPILGNFFDVVGSDQTGVYKLMRECSAKYGTYRFWAFGDGQIHTSRAKEAEVLLSSTRHMDKSDMYQFLTDFLGTGLLISNGKKWQKRRKILTPAFHFNILQQFSSIFNEESVKVVDKIKDSMDRGNKVLDVAKISCRFTLNTICETAMGVKLDSIANADEYRSNLYKVIEIIVHRVMRPWLYIDLVFKVLGYQNQVDKCVRKIKGFTESVINTRRKLFQESHRKEQLEGGDGNGNERELAKENM